MSGCLNSYSLAMAMGEKNGWLVWGGKGDFWFVSDRPPDSFGEMQKRTNGAVVPVERGLCGFVPVIESRDITKKTRFLKITFDRNRKAM